MTVIIAVLIALCASVLGFLWIRGRQDRGDSLPDAGVSTLVFPPQSKFQASGFPRN